MVLKETGRELRCVVATQQCKAAFVRRVLAGTGLGRSLLPTQPLLRPPTGFITINGAGSMAPGLSQNDDGETNY